MTEYKPQKSINEAAKLYLRRGFVNNLLFFNQFYAQTRLTLFSFKNKLNLLGNVCLKVLVQKIFA